MKAVLGRLIDYARREPVRVAYVAAYLVVLAAAQLHVVLDRTTVTDDLLILLPILIGGETARAKVTPVAKRVINAGHLPTDEVNKP